MTASLINNPLNATARTGVSGIVRFYQNVQGEESMVLGRRTNGRGCSWVIPLSSAYRYADEEWLIPTLPVIMNHLGIFNPTRGELMKLADLIIDGIDDLVKTPPEEFEAMARRSRGRPIEGVANIGGTIIEFEA